MRAIWKVNSKLCNKLVYNLSRDIASLLHGPRIRKTWIT
uniref:Uncharacterized protein n=1 Tax=Rhizophora mucronata TaxID=61149 RepID=A0A2P2MLE8_RHIMU